MAHSTLNTESRPAGPPGRRLLGFTLAESLIATTILAIAAVAVSLPIAISHQNTQQAAETQVAVSLARQLLEEIAARPFVDPTDYSCRTGPEAGETGRALFDNIDDYDGYSDSSNGLQSLAGGAVQLGQDGVFRRSVKVEYRIAPGSPSGTTGDFALVTVTVKTPGGQSVSAWRLCCKYPRGSATP